jgi:ABC-type branched-subunit amino acid transport system substrate-binding protein
MRPKTVTVTLAVCAVVIPLLGACASSGSGTPKSGASAAAINLGLIGPLTGTFANAGQSMVTGATVAVNVINAHGGVLGRKVNLIVQDDADDPGDAIPAAQKEIQSNHVVAVVGPGAATASVVLAQADKAKIPDLMFGGGAEFDNEQDPNFFRMSPSDSEQAGAMILYAKSRGWTRIALTIGNNSAAQSLQGPLVSDAKKAGLTVTALVTIAANSTSFRSEITKIFSSHPQAILGQFDIPSAGVLFSELGQQGLLSTPWVVSNLWYTSTFFNTVGAAVANGPIYILNSSSGGPGEQAYLSALKSQTGKTQPGDGDENMWDAVISWALGAAEAGTLNSPQIEAGIVKAANGPGTACYDYSTCLALIKAGKAINWSGAASSTDFNRYHNVFGNFEAIHYNRNGQVSNVALVSAQAIEAAF